ncbi:MAG: hypothetical protein U1E51_34575, partial [Candidatus Binatia bacterium]|nr:hypothetical protein [Candidatus Binatia bacterium]
MDMTSLWVLVKTKRELLSGILLGLVLFGAGWQTGRVSSPYYAANPIIFSDTSSANSPAGDQEQLVDLQEQGIALRSPAATAVNANTATPAVAAASTTAPTMLFVGSVNSTLYHHKDCSTAKRIKTENQI